MNHHQPMWEAAPAGVAGNGHEPGGTAACALCGTVLSTSLMVPDGGRACTDVRWYCRDAGACTGRWTARRAWPAGPQPDPAGAGQEPAGAHLED